MKKKADTKTNAMRVLEEAGISYSSWSYSAGKKAPSGIEAAALLGVPENVMFKTLVTKGASGEFLVFVIPANAELDLKKAAAAAGEKNIHMIPQKELQLRTGYVHGGCSPLAMKKKFRTILDRSAESLEKMLVSAGRVGLSLEVNPLDLAGVAEATFADVARVPA